jgi:hypothetical protein
MKKLILLIIVIGLGITNSILAQTKDIMEQEYRQSFRTGVEKLSQQSWRHSVKDENLEGGKAVRTETVLEEFVLPKKRRYIYTITSAKTKNIYELIQLDDVYYCRKNNEPWKISLSWCTGEGPSGFTGIIKSTYTVEDIKSGNQVNKLYSQYTTHKNSFSDDKEKVYYWQSKFWVNDEGFILKRESVSGLDKTETIYSKRSESYQYNPKDIKPIKAPKIQ